MANVIDYIKWRGDVSFSESPLNEIDALIFSELSYVCFDDLVPASVVSKGIPLITLAEKFFSLQYGTNKLGAILPTDSILELFKMASMSRRFSSVSMKGYINEVDLKAEKQFCAMCFDVGKTTTVVVFRGTDDTIIGWKEDLNMAFFTPVPAQKQAAEYLNSVIDRSERDHYYVCGHSKGGNLASYSALKVKESARDKIVAVYNFDGPGFKQEFLEEEKSNPMISKMHKICPEGAIIGAIFDPIEECRFVKSFQKNIYQHDAFSWHVLGREFIYSQQQKSSRDFHNILEDWVSRLTDKEKIAFVEALYKFFTVNESSTLSDIATDKVGFLIGILKTDDKTKKTFFTTVNKIVKEKYFSKDIKDLIRPTKRK